MKCKLPEMFILILVIALNFSLQSTFAQYDTFNFENYIAGQRLVCQDSINWTTFNLLPCDPIEDPYITSNITFSGANSLVVIPDNDLIKYLGNHEFGYWHIWFMVYIPNGKAGYFNLMSGFTPDPYEWALECVFDPGGFGYLNAGGANAASFYYTYDAWHLVMIYINLSLDVAEFRFDRNLIHTWQWSDGVFGSGSQLNLAANGFYNWSWPPHEMYVDNYLYTGDCLTCPVPSAPSNLTAETIFNPDAMVKLNWQDNSTYEYIFDIYRKYGMPNDPTQYDLISSVTFDSTQFIDEFVVPESTYTYKVIAINPYGSNQSNTATITVPIPVELISFTCEVEKEIVTLFWQTATETNNSGFEIERSQNSNVKNQTEWKSIGFVEGKGTTTENQNYFFTHKPETGKYKYRLKQIDFDGSFEYSPEIEAEILPPLIFSLEQNFPNPFNPITAISWESPSGSWQTLKIYDLLGNEVAILVDEYRPAGKYEIELDATSLPSGIYFYKLQAGNYVETKKMVLLK